MIKKFNKENQYPPEEDGKKTSDELGVIQDQSLNRLWQILHEENQMEPSTEAILKRHLVPLHQIIPGTSPISITPKDQKPKFLYRDTGKVEDLRSDLRDENALLRDAFSRALHDAVEGKSLVDLGAGSGSWGGYNSIAIPYGATNYIAIEPAHFDKLAYSLGGALEMNPREISLHISPNDMLDVLRALPSNTINITLLMSGIDWYILNGLADTPEADEKARQYLNDVKNEIKRILPKGGQIITYASSIGNSGDSMQGYELIAEIQCHEGPACIWRKV